MRLLLFCLELMVSGLSQLSKQFYEWNSFMYLMTLCLLQKTSAWQFQATWQRVAPKKDGSWWRVLTKRGPLEKEVANYISILALRTSWRVWKGKKIWHWKMNSPGREVPCMLLEISGEITPERMNRCSQSKNNTQLWKWLLMEVKSNAVKSNIA